MLRAIFASASTIGELESENKTLNSKVNRLETTLEREREDRKAERRIHEDVNFTRERDYERDRDEWQYKLTNKLTTAAIQHKEEVARLTERAEKAETRAEERFNEKLNLAVSKAQYDTKNKYEAEIVELKDLANEFAEEAAEERGRNGEKDTVIKSLESQIANYTKFVEFAMNKLPEVDLSNFNINVDVPPSEVTVVTQGGGKKN